MATFTPFVLITGTTVAFTLNISESSFGVNVSFGDGASAAATLLPFTTIYVATHNYTVQANTNNLFTVRSTFANGVMTPALLYITTKPEGQTYNCDLVGVANGGIATDWVFAGPGDDTINGGIASDFLDGGAGNDTIHGNSGGDTIRGGVGSDRLFGDGGDDFFRFNAGEVGGAEVINGGDGIDSLIVSFDINFGAAAISAVEKLVFEFGTARFVSFQMPAFNTVVGARTSNLFITMSRGDTNVDLSGVTFQSWHLPLADNEIRIDGRDDQGETLIGSQEIDHINGGGGNDTLDGRGGNDVLKGGAGNDTYIIDAGDLVDETTGSGIDTIRAAFTLDLDNTDHVRGVIENLTLVGAGAVDGTGTTGSNVMTGNAGANRLMGDGGNDTLFGFGGNDTLDGGLGIDRLTGGLGKDIMTGGALADVFAFNTIAEIGKGPTRDVIKDFTHLSDDINLAAIDANTALAGNQAFTFMAAKSALFTGAKGQLRWFQENPAGTANDKTIVQGDVNGDKRADFQIELTGLKILSVADFIL
jgi:Ca2+-binding RTX toxin-like protein